MRVIVTGSRDGYDANVIHRALYDQMVRYRGVFTVVHGAARGVDRTAGEIARKMLLPVEPYPAKWKEDGVFNRQAGFERNRLMLSLGADLVLAFKDNLDITLQRGGTEHMIGIAQQAGLRVIAYTTGGQIVEFES